MSSIHSVLSRNVTALALSGGALGLSLLVGCQPPQPQATYPTNAVMSTPPASPVEMIPAGATLLAEGTYAQVSFKVPSDPGLLYVVDKDQAKVVVKTNVVSEDSGKSMMMSDLRNINQGLDTTHGFKIYYVPSNPTTRPIHP